MLIHCRRRPMRTKKNKEIYEASGEISFPASDKLTSLMYEILRDVAPAGAIEGKLRQIEEETTEGYVLYSNGWLANYAKFLANRISQLPSSKGDALKE